MTVLGFVFSLSTVAFSVLFLRGAQGAIVTAPAAAPVKKKKQKKNAAPVTPAKPYADSTMDFLLKASIASAVVSIAATRIGNDLQTPLRTIFLIFSTLINESFSSNVFIL